MALASTQGNQPALPPIPGALPKTQADWQLLANTLQQWRTALQTPKWFAPTLLNGWANYGAPYEPAGFYIDPSGRVHIRGLVKNGTTGWTTPILTLPNGYWPPYDVIIPGVSADVFCELHVHSQNSVLGTPGGVAVIPSASNAWVSLAGISFSTTP